MLTRSQLFRKTVVAEQAVEPPPANVTTVGETTITLEAAFTTDPGEVLLYRALPEPIPNTPEESLAWAQEFGLNDPEIYGPANVGVPILHVLSSDGQRLTFQNYGGWGEIYYANPAAVTTGNEPLPFIETVDIAVAFLRDHNYLPDAYRVEPELGHTGPVQQVVIRPEVDGGAVDGNGSGVALRLGVNAGLICRRQPMPATPSCKRNRGC